MDLDQIERTEDIPLFPGFPPAGYRDASKATAAVYAERIADYVDDAYAPFSIRDLAIASGAPDKRVAIIVESLIAVGKVRKARYSDAYSSMDARTNTEYWETVRDRKEEAQ